MIRCHQEFTIEANLNQKNHLSRGGTNEYNNLAVACQTCNCKKHTKTEKEFKEALLI